MHEKSFITLGPGNSQLGCVELKLKQEKMSRENCLHKDRIKLKVIVISKQCFSNVVLLSCSTKIFMSVDAFQLSVVSVYQRCVYLMRDTTVIILNIGMDRSEQTVQTQIRLLLMEQSDQGLLCLLFCLHLLNTILHCKIQLFQL